MNLEPKQTTRTYRVIRWLIKLFSPKFTWEGELPPESVILVGNHSQMYGPIACELYCPGKHDIWCAGQMMHLEEVPAYAYKDFWSYKPKWSQPFYKLLSHMIAPLSVCIFNNADTIGVYHDGRIVATFKNTVKSLENGRNVVIFPEKDEPHNHIVYEFQDKFIDAAKLYYKRTGKCVQFVPMYLAPRLKKMYFGKPIAYDPEIPMELQRQQIAGYLMDAITDMAVALPEHTVVPYPNLPQKAYKSNKGD